MDYRKIQDLGFDVYMRDPKDTYCYYTDGTQIGYVQEGRFEGYAISTVHVPNRQTGTGFRMVDHAPEITPVGLQAGFAQYPSWARADQRSSVVKWRDIEHFLNSDSWRKGFRKMPVEGDPA